MKSVVAQLCVIMVTKLFFSGLVFSKTTQLDLKANIQEGLEVNLILHKEYSFFEEQDQESFIPTSIAFAKDGGLYFYDQLGKRIVKILKDSSKKTLIEEIDGHPVFSNGDVFLNVGENEVIYAFDSGKNKVYQFSLDGKYIKETKYTNGQMSVPVVDKNGRFYLPSLNNGVVDVYNSEMTLLEKYLDENDNLSFIFPDISAVLSRRLMFPNHLNVDVWVKNDNVFIMQKNNSKFTRLLNGKKVVSKYLWPNDVVINYKSKVKLGREKMGEKKEFWYLPFYNGVFPDGDNDGIFYIYFGNKLGEKKYLFYQFNDMGDLVKVMIYNANTPTAFKSLHKKNDLFYAIDVDRIIVLKEVSQ